MNSVRVIVDGGTTRVDIDITRRLNPYVSHPTIAAAIDVAAAALESLAADLRRMYPIPLPSEPETTT